MPDSGSCTKLSDAYLEQIHAQYPFLHEATFRQWEAQFFLPSEVADMWQLSQLSLFFLYMGNNPASSRCKYCPTLVNTESNRCMLLGRS